MTGRAVTVGACVAVAVAIRAGACFRPEEWPGPKDPPPPSNSPLPVSLGPAPAPAVARPHGAHPRILLSPERLAALSKLGSASAPSWRRLEARCGDDIGESIDSGYEAWDWVNATLDLWLCHVVTGRSDYAAAAVRYFRAILDDRHKVGDGAGGDEVVHHDDGYSIRTRGCFGAIAYDWLRDAPGMTPELRAHAAGRFTAWTKWFSEKGYSRDQPIANYYVGWFGAVAFGGIALDGDDPRAAALLEQAQRMYRDEVVPAYGKKLSGGDFPEGWQYGDMVGAVLAIFADAESRANGGPSFFDGLPWLRESVAYRTHALWPDGKHMLDTGDWSDKPAVSPTHTLLALATVLAQDDPAARRARFLSRALEDKGEEWLWLAALEDDPARAAEDPRLGATSYLSSGTATVTARTDWSPQATWVAMTTAPSLSDHQHLDAGHFEIVRGGDVLVLDAGGYASYSSLSHNVVVVDDKKENDNYSPNQGTWDSDARVTRFEDGVRFVYALADYTSAYNPAGYPVDHPQRSVLRAERELLFSRAQVGRTPQSARVVIHDRVTVAKPYYRVTFLLHGSGVPETLPYGLRFSAGHSAAFAATLIPAGVAPLLVKEPTDLGDAPFYTNDPPEGTKSVRVEVRSPQGQLEHRFLHAIVVTGAEEGAPPAPVRIDGSDVDGVAIDNEAYVFERDAAQAHASRVAYRAPATALNHVVASLAPGARYVVKVEHDGPLCRIALEPGDGPQASPASSAGVLSFAIAPGCLPR